MIRKLAVLFLLIALLPACAAMPPPFPSGGSASQVRDTDTTLFQAAEASYRRQAYRQAYQQYANYLERYPQGSRAMDARVREAELAGLLGDWQGSLRHYQSILARQPQPDVGLKARYGIGRAYFKLGEYQQATQVLDSLTAAPDLPRSLWFSTQALMAEVALKQGQVPQAFARLRLAAQDLASGDPEWFEDLKTRLLEQATVAELEQLAALYRDNPLSAALLLRLARRAQDSGQSEEARKWAATLKERFPNSPEAAGAERLLAGGKVVVGCLLPLTGQLSNLGFRVQRGMELAAKQASVKLVFRDTASDPEAAAALTRELAQDENVPGHFGIPVVSRSAAGGGRGPGGSGALHRHVPEGWPHPDRQLDISGLFDAPPAGPGDGAPGVQHGNQALRHSLPRFSNGAHLFPEFSGGSGGRRGPPDQRPRDLSAGGVPAHH